MKEPWYVCVMPIGGSGCVYWLLNDIVRNYVLFVEHCALLIIVHHLYLQ